jgi:hypothetical protein
MCSLASPCPHKISCSKFSLNLPTNRILVKIGQIKAALDYDLHEFACESLP